MKKILYILLIILAVSGFVIYTERDGFIGGEIAIAETINIGEKTIDINFTDDNTDEDLIIKSDSDNYSGWGVFDMYFSITNTSDKGQNVTSYFSFPDGERMVIDAKKFISNDTIYHEESSSTPAYEEIVPVWEEKSIEKTKDKEYIKPIKDYKNFDKISSNYIESGETAYFKATITFPRGLNIPEEFFIEAFGDKGSIGHLDPEYVDDDFESYSLADLNGQGSWSGDASAFYVQSTTVQGGTKAVEDTRTTGGWDYIAKSFDAAATGCQEFYIRQQNPSSDTASGIQLWDSSTAQLSIIYFPANGTIQMDYNGGGDVLIASAAANTWYKCQIEWDDNEGTNGGIRSRCVVDGGTLGSWTAWRDAQSDFSTASRIRLAGSASASGNDRYWDTLGTCAAAPTPPAVSAPPQAIIFFE